MKSLIYNKIFKPYLLKLGMAAVFIIGAWLFSACQTGPAAGSKRNPQGINKAGYSYMHGRGAGAVKKPEIYVKKKTVKITPKYRQSETGSLFNINDARNHLYVSNVPAAVGSFLKVNIASTRIDKPSTAAADKVNLKEGNKEEEKDSSSGDAFVGEMLKALPDLEPADKKQKLINKFKMKVAYTYDNGDVLAIFKRASNLEDRGNEIDIKARVPYASLITKDELDTNDLFDIHWVESANGKITERFSSNWEDEYTLRLSGFSEAKSRIALELEEKRRNMQEVKKRLQDQLISLGKERRTMAKEREQVLQKKFEAEKQAKELRAVVDKQKAQIQELTPPEEEKPNDTKKDAKEK